MDEVATCSKLEPLDTLHIVEVEITKKTCRPNRNRIATTITSHCICAKICTVKRESIVPGSTKQGIDAAAANDPYSICAAQPRRIDHVSRGAACYQYPIGHSFVIGIEERDAIAAARQGDAFNSCHACQRTCCKRTSSCKKQRICTLPSSKHVGRI